MPEERRRKEGGAGGDSISRREARDRDGGRLHSRPEKEREPSPKRHRRDGKPASERTHSVNHELNIDDNRERKHRRRFQDVPIDNVSVADTVVKSESQKDGSDRKVGPDGSKRSSDPVEASKSRSFFQVKYSWRNDLSAAASYVRVFIRAGILVRTRVSKYIVLYNNLRLPMQHNERGSAEHASQVSNRSGADDARSKPKERTGEKMEKTEASDCNKKYDRTKAPAGQKTEWKRDGHFELEADVPVPRRRPSFSEKKILADRDSHAARPTESESRNRHDQIYGVSRREEKGNNYPRGDRSERSFDRPVHKRGDRYIQRNEMQRTGYQSRERHSFRETTDRERLFGRYNERKTFELGGLQVEKWKHDLYDEANRSPTPKNEEEQIAKVEALLSL